jgi:hypothetical protein
MAEKYLRHHTAQRWAFLMKASPHISVLHFLAIAFECFARIFLPFRKVGSTGQGVCATYL